MPPYDYCVQAPNPPLSSFFQTVQLSQLFCFLQFMSCYTHALSQLHCHFQSQSWLTLCLREVLTWDGPLYLFPMLLQTAGKVIPVVCANHSLMSCCLATTSHFSPAHVFFLSVWSSVLSVLSALSSVPAYSLDYITEMLMQFTLRWF